MNTGAHAIIHSSDPEADRAFLRDVLKFTSIDIGDGWLIFALPPSEIVVHPSGKNDVHELYLMCEDVETFVEHMAKHDVECSEVQDRSWGMLTNVSLPGGGKLGIYQPLHEVLAGT